MTTYVTELENHGTHWIWRVLMRDGIGALEMIAQGTSPTMLLAWDKTADAMLDAEDRGDA